ncbi:hypothetical protein [Variovorax sp.]|jgi:hypothetical protein|uniref:hypothetical protein n=1 Tax=Variovorax sp. TaxID=1871043 RepID=UPI0037DA72ED
MNAPSLRLRALAAASGLLLAFTGNPAHADASLGYSDAGTGTVTATAHVNLSVRVPKLIVLRVGSTINIVDTLAWTAGLDVPDGTFDSMVLDWDRVAPIVAIDAQPGPLTVSAWTNAGTGTLNCGVSDWLPGTGTSPANADFTVTVTGTLPHPGANLGACASTAFPTNVVATGTWAYVLGGNPVSWTSGTHTSTVTYTATGI